MDYTNPENVQAASETGLLYDLGSLYSYFQQVPDTRGRKGKQYSLALLLLLMLLAKLGGEDKPSGMAEWVAYRVEQLVTLNVLPQARAPSHMTYRRVLQNTVSPEQFEQLVGAFHQSHLAEAEEVVFSMDGKTLKGTLPTGSLRGIHLLSIYVPAQGLVLVETEVDRKTNEIVVAPKLLQQVNLSGAIVIGDALHAQRTVSAQIVDRGGAYIWPIKGNQARTQWAIRKLFEPEVERLNRGRPLSPHCQMTTHVTKGHGRLEKRTLLVSSLLNEYLEWPYVAQVFRLERTVWRTKYPGSQRHVVYGLTSLAPHAASPEKLLAWVRQYWGIENGLHYRRDVTLREDATRLTVGNAGQNMAIFNNLVISLCLQQGFDNLPKARRLFAAQPAQALALITMA